MPNTIDVYLKSISRIPLLSSKEEKELVRKAKEGDKKALDKLIISNLRFVVSIANQYRGHGVPFADLVAAGNLGLVEASKRFDLSRDTKFITYAVWWIKQSISNTIHDFANKNTIPVYDVEDDLVVYDIEDLERKIVEDDLKKVISKLLEELSPKEKAVIVYMYGLNNEEPKMPKEIGEVLRIPTKIIKQIEFSALRKLGKIAVSKGVKEFLRE
jgi:RNA polymerase sigma factor (sigma-70 family)